MKEEFNSALLAKALLSRQKTLGTTTREIAQRIGISASTYSRLTNQKFIPDVYTYFYCCKFLGVDMNFFFEDYEG